MLDKTKTNPALGKLIHEFLVEKGVETPMIKTIKNPDCVLPENRLKIIEENFKTIMETLCLDMEDDSLCETPKRVAKMFLNEIFWGLSYDNFPKCTTIENKIDYASMLIERNIKVLSNCEHHFVPIVGYAYIGYIPNTKIIGLSKINRVVEFFARRPQVQERLTEQIYHALSYILETESVAVVLKCEHLCVKSRGVEDIVSDTVTSKIGGSFLNSVALRNEFMSFLNINH